MTKCARCHGSGKRNGMRCSTCRGEGHERLKLSATEITRVLNSHELSLSELKRLRSTVDAEILRIEDAVKLK